MLLHLKIFALALSAFSMAVIAAESGHGVAPSAAAETFTSAARAALPKKLPPRAAAQCAPSSYPVSMQDNAKVYSEWGHLTNVFTELDANNKRVTRHEFIRIVKNQKEAGYSLWYCDGDANGVRDFNTRSCWQLSPKLFDASATDRVLKDCDLFGKLKKNGFDTPGSWEVKKKLIMGPFPVKFNFSNMNTQSFCAGALDAIEKCVGRRR